MIHGEKPANPCRFCAGRASHEDAEENETTYCDVCGVETLSKRAPRFYMVAIYRRHRCYGGPEEGGWYYDQDELSRVDDHMKLVRQFPDKDAARAYANEAQVILDREEPDNARPLSSVLSNGMYCAVVTDELPHERDPLHRPYYE